MKFIYSILSAISPILGVILVCVGGAFAYSSLGIIPHILSNLNAGSGFIGSGIAFLICVILGVMMIIHGIQLILSGGRKR